MSSAEIHPYGQKKILAIALPMILANVSVPLLGMVDTAILGHLDSPLFLGAVALGANLITLIFWMFGFLRMGTTGFASRLHGAGDWTGMGTLLARSAILALALSATLLLLHPWLLGPALNLLSDDTEITGLATEYAAIRIWSAPATLITYCLLGWFIGIQRARLPLYILVVTNFLNIVLDYLLIVEMGLNSRGAALATLISEYSGLILAVVLLLREMKAHGVHFPGTSLGSFADYRELIRVNSDLFVRTVLLLGTFLFFTSQGTALGQETLAANAILLSLLAFTAYALDGFAFAAEALVGRAIGRGSRQGYWQTIRQTSRMAVAIAVTFSLILFFGKEPILWLFTDLAEVRAIAAEHYHWLVFLPLVAVGCYQLDGIFIGAGYSREMRNSMIFSTALVFLPIWALSRDWGNDGLWLAMFSFHIARLGSQLYLLFYRIRDPFNASPDQAAD